MPGRVLIGLVAALVAMIIILSLTGGPPSEDELAARIAASNVTWTNYNEDIKAQIGAIRAAEWKGEPVEAAVDDGRLRIVFVLSPPWAARDVHMPLLMRTHVGTVAASEAAHRLDDERVEYVFPVETDPGSPPPWVEVKYPHGERRISFDDSGTWAAAP